jgi:hypothetical protein
LRRPHLRALATLATAAALVTGCSSGDDWSRPHPEPTAVGTLGPDFINPASLPAPGATATPRPGSWTAVHPSKSYRVVLLTTGEGRQDDTLVTAVKDWAEDEHADLRTMAAGKATDFISSITKATTMAPDLVVVAGNDLMDPLALVSADHLSQQFLVLGAELAEPTENVTAVGWVGASFRGEGLGASSAYDPGSFTPERCADAIRAGAAAVLNNRSGIVLWLGGPPSGAVPGA